VLRLGETTILTEVDAGLFQLYVFAPLTVIVAVSPLQITLRVLLMLKLGKATNVMEIL
jgi:hypothetical protein